MLKPPSLWSRFSTRSRVVASYVVRQFKQHRAGPRLGFIFTVFEAIVGLVVLALIFSLVGRQAKYGESVVLFMVTGFAPFITFMRVSSRSGMAVEVGGNRNRSNLLTAPGYALAQVVTWLVIMPIAIAVVCAALYFIGVNSAVPIRLGAIVAALVFIALLGFGIGLFNAVVGFFFKPWRPIFEVLTRGLMFLSGVFYVPDYMPASIGEVLAWNPLLHVIALFRLGFYQSYPTILFDLQYLAGFTLGAVFIGLWTERLFRRHYLN